MLDVLTIGDATLDTFIILEEDEAHCNIIHHKKLLCLNYADKISIEHTAQSVGGNAANVAVGIRKLGLSSSIITELGDDMNGQVILAELKRANVQTNLVRLLPGKNTRYGIILNYESERTILSSQVERSYRLPKLPSTHWIYYSSLGKSFAKLQTKLIAQIKKIDSHIAMNPGSYQLRYGLDTVRKMLNYTDLLFVNKEEAELLVSKKQKQLLKKTIYALHQRGVKQIVVTDGENGSYASDGSHIWKMLTYPIKPKAKTGAGDAYASGFLSAIVQNKSLPEAMKWGTANAGGAIQQFGAQHGLLTKSKLQRLIQSHSDIQPTLYT